ncbi:MAG: site-specific integrase [Geobacteraceae bacterium]|nr:site-specific integrase [Geobacteraceae bacterium]
MEELVFGEKKAYRVAAFLDGDGRTRYIVQRNDTFEPSVALSLYEQYLAHKSGSSKSTKDVLEKLVHFFTWADIEGVDVEGMLLRGETPTAVQVRSFVYWLGKRITNSGREKDKMGLSTYNKVLMYCGAMFGWFVMHYGVFNETNNMENLDRQKLRDFVKGMFGVNKKKDKQKRFADDLSEEEIGIIEAYLKPGNRKDVNKATAHRDYLMWRLAIEFGFREGEILALRLEDCPHGRQQHISIVRVEERGKNYHDPRGTNSPRPKTLSRQLGFILKDSPIPRLLSDYMSEHRCRVVTFLGKTKVQPVLDHNFLIINHQRKDGRPLSAAGMQRIAEKISQNTGVTFRWHIARHAFFNRMYAGIASSPDYKDRLLDLVEFGGWSDEKSLQLYINRARRIRATNALIFWQSGGVTWNALR